MRSSFFKKKSSIQNKLNDYLKSISLDPFGYQKNIKVNVLRFFVLSAKAEHKSIENLHISIRLLHNKVHAVLHKPLGSMKNLSPKELTALFTGDSFPNTWILNKIENCLRKIAEREDISIHHISILIKISNCQPVIELYDKDTLIKEMAMKEIVKLFSIV